MQMDLLGPLLWTGEYSSHSSWKSGSLNHSFPYQGQGFVYDET